MILFLHLISRVMEVIGSLMLKPTHLWNTLYTVSGAETLHVVFHVFIFWIFRVLTFSLLPQSYLILNVLRKVNFFVSMVSLWSESVICTVSHCGTCWRYLLLQTTASLIMALRSLEPVVLWLLANDLEFHFTGKHTRSISRQFPSSHNLPACQNLGFMPCSLHSPCYRIDLVLFLDQPMRVHEISPCYVCNNFSPLTGASQQYIFTAIHLLP